MQVARPKSNAAIRFQRRNPGSSMIHDTKCEEKVRVLSSPIVALPRDLPVTIVESRVGVAVAHGFSSRSNYAMPVFVGFWSGTGLG